MQRLARVVLEAQKLQRTCLKLPSSFGVRPFHATSYLQAGRKTGSAALEPKHRELSKKQKKRKALQFKERAEKKNHAKEKIKDRITTKQTETTDIMGMVNKMEEEWDGALTDIMSPDYTELGTPEEQLKEALGFNPMSVVSELRSRVDAKELNSGGNEVSTEGSNYLMELPDKELYTSENINKTLSVFAAQGRRKLVDEMVTLMNNLDIKLDVNSYTGLMLLANNKNDYNKAEKLFNTMLAEGLDPTIHSWDALIDAKAKSGDAEGALKQLNRLKDLKIKPTNLMYESVLASHIQARKYDEAFEIWVEMHFDVELTVEAFNLMLKQCSQTRQVERAFFYMDEMRVTQVEPNLKTFVQLFRACAEAPHWVNGYHDIIFDAMTRMEGQEMVPNEAIYSAIIYAFGRARDPVAAEYYFWEMKRKGIEPNLYTYNSLINAFAKAQVVGAREHGAYGRWSRPPPREPSEDEQAMMDIGPQRMAKLMTEGISSDGIKDRGKRQVAPLVDAMDDDEYQEAFMEEVHYEAKKRREADAKYEASKLEHRKQTLKKLEQSKQPLGLVDPQKRTEESLQPGVGGFNSLDEGNFSHIMKLDDLKLDDFDIDNLSEEDRNKLMEDVDMTKLEQMLKDDVSLEDFMKEMMPDANVDLSRVGKKDAPSSSRGTQMEGEDSRRRGRKARKLGLVPRKDLEDKNPNDDEEEEMFRLMKQMIKMQGESSSTATGSGMEGRLMSPQDSNDSSKDNDESNGDNDDRDLEDPEWRQKAAMSQEALREKATSGVHMPGGGRKGRKRPPPPPRPGSSRSMTLSESMPENKRTQAVAEEFLNDEDTIIKNSQQGMLQKNTGLKGKDTVQKEKLVDRNENKDKGSDDFMKMLLDPSFDLEKFDESELERMLSGENDNDKDEDEEDDENSLDLYREPREDDIEGINYDKAKALQKCMAIIKTSKVFTDPFIGNVPIGNPVGLGDEVWRDRIRLEQQDEVVGMLDGGPVDNEKRQKQLRLDKKRKANLDKLMAGEQLSSGEQWDLVEFGRAPDANYDDPLKVRRQTNIHRAEVVFQDMQAQGLQPNLITLNSLMAVYGDANRAEDTVRIFNSLDKYGLRPDSKSITVLMRAYIYSKDINSALQLKQDCGAKYGLQLEPRCYGLLINSLVNRDMLVDALQLLEEASALKVKIPEEFLKKLRNRCNNLGLQHPDMPADPNLWIKKQREARKQFKHFKGGDSKVQSLKSHQFS